MKTLTSRQVSPWYNTQIGNPEKNSDQRNYPPPEEMKRGERMRRIEAINEIIDLGQALSEVWDE